MGKVSPLQFKLNSRARCCTALVWYHWTSEAASTCICPKHLKNLYSFFSSLLFFSQVLFSVPSFCLSSISKSWCSSEPLNQEHSLPSTVSWPSQSWFIVSFISVSWKDKNEKKNLSGAVPRSCVPCRVDKTALFISSWMSAAQPLRSKGSCTAAGATLESFLRKRLLILRTKYFRTTCRHLITLQSDHDEAYDEKCILLIHSQAVDTRNGTSYSQWDYLSVATTPEV